MISDYFDRLDPSLNVLNLINIMPKIISPEQKLSIIEDWLDGENRDLLLKLYSFIQYLKISLQYLM